MGTLNFALAVILLLLGIIGVLEKPLLSPVTLLAFFRFGSNSIYELTAIGGMQTASGVFNCVIFLVALYGGFALALEDVPAPNRPSHGPPRRGAESIPG